MSEKNRHRRLVAENRKLRAEIAELREQASAPGSGGYQGTPDTGSNAYRPPESMTIEEVMRRYGQNRETPSTDLTGSIGKQVAAVYAKSYFELVDQGIPQDIADRRAGALADRYQEHLMQMATQVVMAKMKKP